MRIATPTLLLSLLVSVEPAEACLNGMLQTSPGSSLGLGVALVVLLVGAGWFLLRRYANP